MLTLPIDWYAYEMCHRCFADTGEVCTVVEPGKPAGKEMIQPHFRRHKVK